MLLLQGKIRFQRLDSPTGITTFIIVVCNCFSASIVLFRATSTQCGRLQHQGQTEWVSSHSTTSFSLINTICHCEIVTNKTCSICLAAELIDVETNERVNNTYHNMQMPKVENKTLVIDDYSMCPSASWISGYTTVLQPGVICSNIITKFLLSVVALTMQILKPAGFIETAHYPLLLLV